MSIVVDLYWPFRSSCSYRVPYRLLAIERSYEADISVKIVALSDVKSE